MKKKNILIVVKEYFIIKVLEMLKKMKMWDFILQKAYKK